MMYLIKSSVGRGRLIFATACTGIVLVLVGASIYSWDRTEDDGAGFCWSLIPTKESKNGSSLSACGNALESLMAGEPSNIGGSDGFREHTDEENWLFEDVVRSYGKHASEDPSLMPPEISENMANVLVSYSKDVYQILGGIRDISKTENNIHVNRRTMISFVRGVANSEGAFRVICETQVEYAARNINALGRAEFSAPSEDGVDRAKGVVGDAGRVMGSLAQIQSEALRNGKDGESVDGETKKKLIDDYENRGFPHLRKMIHARAEKIGIPRDDIVKSGGRMADITAWANSAYNTA